MLSPSLDDYWLKSLGYNWAHTSKPKLARLKLLSLGFALVCQYVCLYRYVWPELCVLTICFKLKTETITVTGHYYYNIIDFLIWRDFLQLHYQQSYVLLVDFCSFCLYNSILLSNSTSVTLNWLRLAAKISLFVSIIVKERSFAGLFFDIYGSLMWQFLVFVGVLLSTDRSS